MIYPKLIILHFRRYAAGNFLANILCHNKNFVPKFVFDRNEKRYDGSIMSLDADNLFIKQLDLLQTTLPESKQQGKEWGQYELGCTAFWAKNKRVHLAYNPTVWKDNLNSEPFELMNKGKYCFIVSHTYTALNCINQCLPGATTIQLLNDERTIRLGFALKGTENSYRLTANNPVLMNAITFNVDTLWDKTKFFNAVYQLLDNFDIVDKTLHDSVYQYHDRYVQLHL